MIFWENGRICSENARIFGNFRSNSATFLCPLQIGTDFSISSESSGLQSKIGGVLAESGELEHMVAPQAHQIN